MKHRALRFLKLSMYYVLCIFCYFFLAGYFLTIWPFQSADTYGQSFLGNILCAGWWLTFWLLAHFLSSFEGIVLLFLIVIFMYYLRQFLNNVLKKYTKTVFKRKK